ncbi:MAG: hypothetical protein ACOCXT_04615 [Candidatus Dojkabacteria bacterium]
MPIDLRFSDVRSKIYTLLGEDEHQSYYQMSTRLGHDIHRFYTKVGEVPAASAQPAALASERGNLILCPYCCSPIPDQTKLCPHCNEDTTRDALIEMRKEEYKHSERTSCQFCGEALLKLANRCPRCKQRLSKD